MTDLRTLVRTATASQHQQLESLPFFRALRTGSLPKLPIVSFLRCLAILHAVLERELGQVSSPEMARLAAHARPKTPLLIADLELVGAQHMPSITPAIHCALAAAAELLTNANSPAMLAGALYVLEGSQNGGVVLRDAYARCLEVDGERLLYFGCYGKATAAHWQEFVNLLNALALDEQQAQEVARAAVRCFEWLDAICAALHPHAPQDVKHHVADVNFEAGDHAMPQDPLEIALALRAGRAAWQMYPYLDLRFGERGKRFTSSDSCWLVALARAPVETATRSLKWLRTVLASRGLPTVILEGHLRAIQDGLAADLPAAIDLPIRYDPFLAGLEAERRAHGGETLQRLVADFDQRLCAVSGFKVDSAAALLASAWLDERCGIRGALASTRDWFTDGGRFSKDWIVLVGELLAALDGAGGASC